MKLIVGDQVKVTVGKDKGKTGQVTRVVPKKNLLFVEGVGKTIRHVKPSGNQSGERKTIFKPIDASKVAIINDKGEIDRVGYKVSKTGEKERFYKKTGKMISLESSKKVAKTKAKPVEKSKPKSKAKKK